MCKKRKSKKFLLLLSCILIYGLFGFTGKTKAAVEYIIRVNVFMPGQMPDTYDVDARFNWIGDRQYWETIQWYFTYTLPGRYKPNQVMPDRGEISKLVQEQFDQMDGANWRKPPLVVRYEDQISDPYDHLLMRNGDVAEGAAAAGGKVIAPTLFFDVWKYFPEKPLSKPEDGTTVLTFFVKGQNSRRITGDPLPVVKPYRHTSDGEVNRWKPSDADLKKMVTNVIYEGRPEPTYHLKMKEEFVDTEKVGTTEYTVILTAVSGSPKYNVTVPITITPGILRARDAPLQKLATSDKRPDDNTIKSWFDNKIDVVNEDGKVIEEGLGTGAYDVELLSKWENFEPGRQTLEAKITYKGTGYKGKLKSESVIGKIPVDFSSSITADPVPVTKAYRYPDNSYAGKWVPKELELWGMLKNVKSDGKLLDFDKCKLTLKEEFVDTEKVGTTDYTVILTADGSKIEVKVPVTISPGVFYARDAIPQRFIMGTKQPDDNTIKSWFNGRVDVVNTDGKIIEEGLGATAYEVKLISEWKNYESGQQMFEVEVTYIGPGYQGKLQSNQAIGRIPISFYPLTAEPAQVKKGFRHADDGEKNKWTPTAEELKTWVTNVQLDGKPVTDYQVSLNEKTVDTEKVGTTDYTVTVSGAGATTEVKVPVEITPGIFQVRDADVQRFAVGSEQPADSTIKSWFDGKVDVVNEDGKIIEEGLGSTAYEVTLKSPWNSKEVGTKPFEAEVTYIGPGYQGKLKSNQAIGKIPIEFYTITAEPAQVKKGFRHADDGEKNKWTPTAEELKTWVTNVQLDGKPVTDYQVSLNGKTVDTEKVGTTDYTVTVSSAGATAEVKVPVEITPGIFQVRDADVQRFAVGSEQPTDSTIKSWFNGKVDVVNEDGKIIEEGLGSTAYEVTLKSPWNSKEVGTKTFEAEVTYIGPGYQGKLKSNQAIGKIPVEFDDSGTFVWDIPHQLGFQQAKTTSSKTQMIHRTEADWKINVTDTKEERKKWGITARLDKEFTHKKDTNKKMKNILKFQSAQHEIYTLNTDHSVPIYMTADDPPKAEDLEIKWGKDQGFYLEIPAYDYHVKGEYDATIEFALEWTY